jgi:hypothetical protein
VLLLVPVRIDDTLTNMFVILSLFHHHSALTPHSNSYYFITADKVTAPFLGLLLAVMICSAVLLPYRLLSSFLSAVLSMVLALAAFLTSKSSVQCWLGWTANYLP